ncbi:uncharacterized protein LODBEIA_P01680 [Lodderomyces beijingensis]|uniref:FAD-binding FR-type domain-containing protein n=1 Tax=Lodderomyces beijingensis TaxID=1775926 RepID=A0ABP0ZDH4_9ASCO
MYIPALFISLGLAILLVPFLVPIRSKSPLHHRLKTAISVCLVVSSLVAIAPERAQIGAPFHKYGKSKIAFYGCNYQIVLTQARFCEPDKSLEWCYCNNFNAFATIAHCYKIAHPGEVDSLLDMCRQYKSNLGAEVVTRANAYYDHHARKVENFTNSSSSLLRPLTNFPAKLNETETLIFEHAYRSFLGNFDLSVDYGAYLVLFWICVFCLAAVGNWSKIWLPGLQQRLTDPVTNWFRHHVSLPATGTRNKTNEQPFAYFLHLLVPTRAETLILLASLILCVYFMTANISYVEDDPLFNTKGLALLRYYAVRASILSSSLMPLLILFGGRNNFLQWFTRWDYATFITLHRWVSREIMVMICIHSVNYSYYLRLRNRVIETYVYIGSAAFMAGVAIMIQGLLILRRKWYEVFLLLHIVLAAVFIFGAWLHVEDMYCVWFYYTCAAIWAFDRIIRVLRLYSFGIAQARVYLLPDETLKVVVSKPKPDNWEAVPGGHAFIHFLRPSCFWQSHPFTYTMTEDEICLFIKVKKGVTLQLAEYLKTHKDKKFTHIPVAIEGPYGEKTPAGRYDSSVFIAGGNGIPGIYSEVVELEQSTNADRKSKCKLKLVWVVREFTSLLWFYEELLKLQNSKNIETVIFITRPALAVDPGAFKRRRVRDLSVESEILQESNELTPLVVSKSQAQTYTAEMVESDSYSEDPTADIRAQIKSELSHIDFFEAKPNIAKLVETSIVESTGSTCFVTCGHPAMVDDIRAAVVANIANGEKKRVDYFEQLQVWA